MFYWDQSHNILKEISKTYLETRFSENKIQARLAYNGGLALTGGAYIYIEDITSKGL